MRPAAAVLAVAAIVAGVLAGCARTATPGGAGMVLRLAINSEPRSLVPMLAQGIQDNEILRLIYEPLIACDGAGNPVPALAREVPTRANGGISADGLTIAYRLRRGVRWHDGTPFTSDDVRASFDAVMDPRSTVQTRHGYDVVARVETPDPYTVRFRLKRRFAPFVGTVFAESDEPYYLAPAHVLRGPLAQSPLASAPVGTGPYRVVRWARGDRLDLTANDRYWNGKPSIARVAVRFMPDENSQLVALRSGELDGVLVMSANAAASARAVSGVRLVTSPLNAYYGVMFNNARGATADVRVRRAIARALDAQAFRAKVTHGFYTAPIADLPRALWAADTALRPVARDLADARRLLAAAGYGPARRLALDLAIISASQTHRAEAVNIQSELRPLGIDVRVHPYLPVLYDAPAVQGGILPSGRYDLAIYGWFAGMDPDDSGQFTCDQRPPRGFDHAFFCDPAMDAAQRDALASYDRTVRKRAYARVEALLLRDAPIAFLASPVAIDVLRDGVGGWSPSLVTQTANAQRWTLRR